MKQFSFFLFLFFSYWCFSQSKPIVIHNISSYWVFFRVDLYKDDGTTCLPWFNGTSNQYRIPPGATVKINSINDYDYPSGSGNYLINSWCYRTSWSIPCNSYGPAYSPPTSNLTVSPTFESQVEWQMLSMQMWDSATGGNAKDDMILGREGCNGTIIADAQGANLQTVGKWLDYIGNVEVTIDDM